MADHSDIERNKEVVRTLIDQWGDPDVLRAIATSDFEWVIEVDPSSHRAGGAIRSVDTLIDGWEQIAQRLQHPDGSQDGIKHNVTTMTAEEDRVVVELFVTASLKRDPSRSIKNRGVFVCELRDSKIARIRVYEDTAYLVDFWKAADPGLLPRPAADGAPGS